VGKEGNIVVGQKMAEVGKEEGTLRKIKKRMEMDFDGEESEEKEVVKVVRRTIQWCCDKEIQNWE
jgi:hypothetical protein